MNSENKTSNKKSLKIEEICNIIRQCAQAHVSEFVFGELHIKFSPATTEIAGENHTQNYYPPPIQDSPTKSRLAESNFFAPTPPYDAEDDALLAVTDPVEYERRQLEDDEHEASQDREA